MNEDEAQAEGGGSFQIELFITILHDYDREWQSEEYHGYVLDCLTLLSYVLLFKILWSATISCSFDKLELCNS